MFVSTGDYPFFREDKERASKKKSRFNLEHFRSPTSKSQENILDSSTEEKKKKENATLTEKKQKKRKIKNNESRMSNLLDSINEVTKTQESNKNPTEITGDNLNTLIKYKKLEKDNKKNPIFHLPPLVTKPLDPETTFMTFGELDELNERIFQNQQLDNAGSNRKEKKSNRLNLELTYNKTQFQKLKTHYSDEEISSFKHLFQTIRNHKIKENKTPKIKTYSSQAFNGERGSNFFTEIEAPQNEEKKEKEIIEKKKEKEKKKNIISLENLYFESLIYFYSYEQNGWRPEIRELCTMIVYEKKVIIYSGIGRNIMDDIVVADLGNLTWEKITQSGEVPSFGRYGHTAVLYNRKMFIFGGEKKYNSHLKQHECLNDVRYFSLENFKWKYIRPIGDLVDARRNHVATIVGRYMIINGGISPKDQYLNDFWQFDFMISKWVMIPVKGANKNGIAFHACCSVFLSERTKIVLNKPLESITDDSGKKLLQYEGIYFFGGKNGFYFSNELTILQIDQNPMVLIKPEIGGKPPLPRYGHSMVFNDVQNIVIIYGGRNDYENSFFGDVHILKLNLLCWVSVKVQGIPKAPRASHCACSFNTKLVVFGGLNLNGLTNSDIVMIEFDTSQVKKFVSLENTMVKPNQIQIEDKGREKDPKPQGGGGLMEDLKSKAQMLYFEEEQKQKIKRQKMEMLMETLKYQNFKSFLPLPNNRFVGRPHGYESNTENANNNLKSQGWSGKRTTVMKKSQIN